MNSIHLIFFLLLFRTLPAYSQSVDYSPKLESAWQIGSCNCYLFNISIWENTEQNSKFTSRKIHHFHLISGLECKEFKENSNLLNQAEIPHSLKELSPCHPFKLSPADLNNSNQLSSLNEYELLNAYTEDHQHISLILQKWADKSEDNRKIFSLIIAESMDKNNGNHSAFSERIIFGLFEITEESAQ